MRVTVIIPSYNHALYIAQCIESVLSQDWSEIDLIVIDDGSSDDSPKVIRKLLGDRKDCQFIARENRGLISTMNEGIAVARGECLCGLASDDYLLPGSLRARVEHLERNPDCIAVFADGILVSDSGKREDTLISERVRRLFKSRDPIRELVQGVSVPLQTMMVRTEVIRRIGAFDTRFQFCDDLDIQTRLFLEGRVDLIDASVHAYRRHEANLSRTENRRFCADWVLCYRKYLYETPQLAPYRRLIRRRLTRKYRALGKYLNQVGRGSDLEESVFRSGWAFAWRDLRLLWRLIRWQLCHGIRTRKEGTLY